MLGVNACEITCVDDQGCDFIADCQTFYLDRQLADISLLALTWAKLGHYIIKLCFTFFTKKSILKFAKPANQVRNRRVSRQEKHQIWRVFNCFFNDTVEFWKDMLQGILFHAIISSATPRWRHEHSVKLFVRIRGWESNTLVYIIAVIFHHSDLMIAF